MKLHRTRTHCGFVYYSHKDSGQAEWKVERDCTVPFRRYTVCRLEVRSYQGKREYADWLIEHDARTLRDATDYITSQMNPKETV